MMTSTPDSPGSGDQSTSYPMHNAVKQRKNVEVAALLDADISSVSSVDEHGRTPLHMAVLFKNLAAAELLISRGANCNVEDATGRTPLHLAGSLAAAPFIDRTLSLCKQSTLSLQLIVLEKLEGGKCALIDIFFK